MRNLVFLFAFFACSAAPLDVARKNYVKVYYEDGNQQYAASGIALSKHQFLTCNHVVTNYPGEELRVVAVDEVLDIALVRTKMNLDPALRWGNPEVGEEVRIVSNAEGLDGALTKHVISRNWLTATAIYPPAPLGASGAGVYNEEGELVGMVVRKTEAFGIIIPSSVLRGFLKERFTHGEEEALHDEALQDEASLDPEKQGR